MREGFSGISFQAAVSERFPAPGPKHPLKAGDWKVAQTGRQRTSALQMLRFMESLYPRLSRGNANGLLQQALIGWFVLIRLVPPCLMISPLSERCRRGRA
jgi:hypothetical protein